MADERAVQEATIAAALDAVAVCIEEAVHSKSPDRFAVALRLSNIGQALVREGQPGVDAYAEEDEDAEYGTVANPLYRRRRRNRRLVMPGDPVDQVDMMREVLAMLQGQTTATRERDRATELRELIDIRGALEERGDDVSAINERIRLLTAELTATEARLALPEPQDEVKTTGTEIKEKETCSGTSPASTETSTSHPSPGSTAASP